MKILKKKLNFQTDFCGELPQAHIKSRAELRMIGVNGRSKKSEKKGKNPKDYICGKACDSYNRYKEDLDLAVSLNSNSIRIGIEWARIQPKKDVWDVEAINHYRDVLQEAKKRNLKTVVTLWHWTNPVWLARE